MLLIYYILFLCLLFWSLSNDLDVLIQTYQWTYRSQQRIWCTLKGMFKANRGLELPYFL